MNRETTLSIVRHILTFSGGIVVSRGYLDDATLQAGIGALMTLVGILWGVADKKARAEA